MKRNTFYILLGIVALLEVVAFWVAVQLARPIVIQVAFILGVLLLYAARRMVEERLEDERTNLITQKAALRTLEGFWVIFFAVSLGSAVLGFSRPLGLRGPPPPDGQVVIRVIQGDPALPHIGWFGIGQMALLGLMILLYVGFRIYYGRKYGGWDSDEE